MTRHYDNYGRDQFSIENLHLTPSVTGKELLDRGLQLLNQRDYRQAVNVLSDAIRAEPSMPDAHYYLAIAMLGGKKPRKIDGWTIRDIEEELNAAIHGNTDSSKCYVLLAIVKHGYYVMNSLIETLPTSDQLFNLGENIRVKDAREILCHLDDPSNPHWVRLYKKFGKPC